MMSRMDYLRTTGDVLPKYFTKGPNKSWRSIHSQEKPKDLFLTHRRDTENEDHEFMGFLGNKLGFKTMNDWYQISQTDFLKNGGTKLLNRYSGSPSQVIMKVFPIHNWDILKFKRKPLRFWENENNISLFMKNLGNELRYTTMEDWYKISREDFDRNGGAGLLYNYNYSPSQVLIKTFPHHNWDISKFKNKPMRFWEKENNISLFITDLGNKLGYKTMGDWYNISQKDFNRNGGKRLLRRYNGSPSQALIKIFPHHDWDVSKFSNKPGGFWENKNNISVLLENLGNKLGYKTMEDWYKISSEDFRNGGSRLLQKYGLVSECVMIGFPNHPWHPWLFNGRKGDPKDSKYIQWLSEQVEKWRNILNITKYSQWYNVNINYEMKINQFPYMEKIMKEHTNLYNVLILVFPSEDWDERKFCKNNSEQLLGRFIEEIYPNDSMFHF